MKFDVIQKLEQEIVKHKADYYSGNATISDEDYDKLEDQLRKLDPHNPVLKMVGAPLDESVDKIKHDKKMLSLEKTYEIKKIALFISKNPAVAIQKIDGSSCSLIYENGILKIAKTRGDGSFGENILQKCNYITEIPKRISYNEEIEIRGEVFCTDEDFIRISKNMTKRGHEKPTSQRNIVAGILTRKEEFQTARYLSFRAFDLIHLSGFGNKLLGTEISKIQKLEDLGFKTPPHQLISSVSEAEKIIGITKYFYEEGTYLIDGLVFSYNDLGLHEELGETSSHPRYKIAFKFEGKTAITKINDIVWQISRNGILTPVAEVEPVELSGASISRVTLHNLSNVKSVGLAAGDSIEIIRSGEVIPKFLRLVEKGDALKRASIPKKCPWCKCELVEEEIRLICENMNCPGIRQEEVLHWIKEVNVEDLSEKRLQEMIAQGLVEAIPDLYRIKVADLMTLDKVKDKLAAKIFENIQKTKTLDLVVFLAALGVEGISTTKAEKIVAHGHNTIDKILDLDVAALVSIDGFAEKSATDIVRSIQSKKKLIKALDKVGIEITAPEVVSGGVLEGKKFCITGALSHPRGEIEKMIKRHGGVVVGSVSKNTDYLLTNDTDPASSKYKKALEVGTTVITEAAFRDLVGE